MNLGEFFGRFNMDKVTLSTRGVSLELVFDESDRNAAWEIYVEMLTRVLTQRLPDDFGDEDTALESVYEIFHLTREILRRHGRGAERVTWVVIPVLNQVVRPFTAKWHKARLAGAFSVDENCKEFRAELEVLQEDLRNYNRALAMVADVEDMTYLEDMEKRD